MSTPDKYYTVSRTGNGLVCSCLDHQRHKSDCKHIHVILDIVKQNRGFTNNEFKIIERHKLELCKFYSSDNVRKRDFRIVNKIKF